MHIDIIYIYAYVNNDFLGVLHKANCDGRTAMHLAASEGRETAAPAELQRVGCF